MTLVGLSSDKVEIAQVARNFAFAGKPGGRTFIN